MLNIIILAGLLPAPEEGIKISSFVVVSRTIFSTILLHRQILITSLVFIISILSSSLQDGFNPRFEMNLIEVSGQIHVLASLPPRKF
jgi:hypothetical protein